MRTGEKISRMIVGALFDTNQISGAGELAVDIHVQQVLGVCAAEETRYYMSMLSAAHTHYAVVTMTQNRSTAQTPRPCFTGDIVSADEALRIAKAMKPSKSWMLDAPLYSIGKSLCKRTEPKCAGCYLRERCNYDAVNA